jgi:hypothetical protein
LYAHDPALLAEIVFSDLSPEEGKAWVKRFVQHSGVSFTNELTYEGYKDVPVSYLFCEADKCVTPEIQQRCIDTIEQASGNKVDVTRIPYDHVPIVLPKACERLISWWESLAEKSDSENGQ